jgi:hypothetical protein
MTNQGALALAGVGVVGLSCSCLLLASLAYGSKQRTTPPVSTGQTVVAPPVAPVPSPPAPELKTMSVGTKKKAVSSTLSAVSTPLAPSKGVWKKARNTFYNSYPACCPKSPTYDPKAGKGECGDFSGCKWMGQFKYGGTKSYDYVKSNNIIAFFDKGAKDAGALGGKQIRLRKNGKEFAATVLDTCGDSDCSNCCSKNAAETGYLVDIEAETCKRVLGSTDACSGDIEWQPA